MKQGEKKALTKSQIAKAVGCAPSLLSRGRFKDMPKFYSVEEYKIWEVQTRMRGSSKFEMEVIAARPVEPDPVERDQCAGGGIEVDWSKFETTAENHLDVTLNRAERISNMAYAMLDKATERNDLASTFGAIKNWSAALREECEVRGRLLQLQMDTRTVIHLDEVSHVVGLVIQELVAQIEAALNRGAVRANPADPGLALRAYQQEFDGLKMRLQETLSRVESELDNGEGAVCG